MAAGYVVIRLFSGRPDPRFTLAGTEADDLRSLVSSLPEAPGPANVEPEATLGYRGMQVHFADGAELLVFHDQVELREPGGVRRRRADPAKRVEQALVALARRRLGEQLPWAWIVGDEGTTPDT